MPNLKELPIGENAPDEINVVIEIPKGTHTKIEYDAKLEVFRLDRVLYSAVHYPTAYGFIPQTLWDDGDPLDVLVLNEEPLQTGLLLRARPVGVLVMTDEKGSDSKILAVPSLDPRYNDVTEITDVPKHFLREAEHFFETYKELEGKFVKSFGWEPSHSAKQAIMKSSGTFKLAHD
ncbi:MAG: inorganic diphosphatase [Bacteroidetes bacterium]|nr:inorganic diphosphatase [Bacteroidota bacterium]MCL5035453.1 inorganic diphosphatase [Bacteroidota bacterium]